MTLALRPVSASSGPAKAEIARVAIFHDMAAAQPYWRALEAADALATPYQRYEFLNLWQRHVGAPGGMTPFIVVGLGPDNAPVMLCPFGRRTLAGFRVLEFLGGKHANFNMALWRRDVARNISADALRSVIEQLAPHADALMLHNQPHIWRGEINPFIVLPHQRSADSGFSGTLAADFDALLHERTNSIKRKKMRKKERALAEAGPLRFSRADEPAERARVLDAFFAQKNMRMRARGQPNIFAEADTQQFIAEAIATPIADGNSVIELFSLRAGETIVATLGGTVGGGRFCAMFNAMIDGPLAVQSPGEQLLVHLVRACCERGLASFDLGVGVAVYKDIFCPDTEPLFESFLPLTSAGKLLAVAAKSGAAAKRTIKQSPALWSLVQSLRRLRAR